MEWLSQNWIWLALAIGAVWLLSRMRHGSAMGGCCGGMAHEGPHEARKAEGGDTPPPAVKDAGDTASHRRGCC